MKFLPNGDNRQFQRVVSSRTSTVRNFCSKPDKKVACPYYSNSNRLYRGTAVITEITHISNATSFPLVLLFPMYLALWGKFETAVG